MTAYGGRLCGATGLPSLCAGNRLIAIMLMSMSLLLNGCAELGVKSPTWPWRKGEVIAAHDERAVTALDNWSLSGRLGVQHDDSGFSAGIDWRQRFEDFDIRLSAPLNGGTYRLSGEAGAVTIEKPDGESDRATSAEELMLRHLGWSIPVSGVRYWVRGLPAPNSEIAHQTKDELGRLTDFAQDGWRISILDHRKLGDLTLPRKLFLVHSTLKVRLVIKNWERY